MNIQYNSIVSNTSRKLLHGAPENTRLRSNRMIFSHWQNRKGQEAHVTHGNLFQSARLIMAKLPCCNAVVQLERQPGRFVLRNDPWLGTDCTEVKLLTDCFLRYDGVQLSSRHLSISKRILNSKHLRMGN